LEKWWNIRNVKPPVYIGIREKHSRYGGLLFVIYAFIILALYILESIDIVPQGTALSTATSTMIFDVIYRGLIRRKTSALNIAFLKRLLETLDGRLIRWCIPSNTIPVTGVLDNGVYIVVYTDSSRNKLFIALFKPLINYRVYPGKPVFKYKWIRRTERESITSGLVRITYPHVDIRRMNYSSDALLILVDAGIDFDKLLDIINRFNEYVGESPLTGAVR
jgi:hypothetical protein